MDIFEQKGIEPMLIADQVDPYDDTDSIFELKLDGIRCIAYFDRSSIDLRNKRDIRLIPRFPELDKAYSSVNQKCILDGELIVAVNGKPDFYRLQRRTMLTDPFKMKIDYMQYSASFVAYDILYYKNKLLILLPLIERKQILSSVVEENLNVSVSRYIEGEGKHLYRYINT